MIGIMSLRSKDESVQCTNKCVAISLTYRIMVASFDRSNKWAASTAETMAPSNAEKSQNSSVTRNFRAKLKNAAGFFDALTAITCLSFESASPVAGMSCSEGFCC